MDSQKTNTYFSSMYIACSISQTHWRRKQKEFSLFFPELVIAAH